MTFADRAGEATLVLMSGWNAEARYSLGAKVIAVGWHPESDIFLDDVTVSKRHAEFFHQAPGYSVRDVGSLNGTYVNGTRVQEVRLASGDEVQIGKFKFIYVAVATNGEPDQSDREELAQAGTG